MDISPTQHCTYPSQNGEADFSFSHTAQYCGRPQPRRCGCAFCYPEEPVVALTVWNVYESADDGYFLRGTYTSESSADLACALLDASEHGLFYVDSVEVYE